MKGHVEFFGSLQSPYCYFALDRLDDLFRDFQIEILVRPILPGVIRIPEVYRYRRPIEHEYFNRDVLRTASYLNLPYSEPDPSPVNWESGSIWIARPEQSRIKRFYNIIWQAHLKGKLYSLYGSLMRLIWSGQHPGWDNEGPIRDLLTSCELPVGLADQPHELLPEANDYFSDTQKAMYDSGHWGVPLFVFENEPFYGQDRLDQLKWRVSRSR